KFRARWNRVRERACVVAGNDLCRRAKAPQEFAGDEPMALDVRMNTIAGEHEIWIGAPVFGEKTVHWTVRVHDLPALSPLSQQPFRVAVEHFVVSLVRRPVFSQAGRERVSLQRHRIECRWRDMNDLRARRRSTL